MNPLIELKTTPPLLITLALLCLGLLPKAQAVVPAPDGCYPGFTTAEGCLALQNLTTGAANTGVGWRALFTDMTGSFNTGVGAGTLVLNTSDSNTAVGAAAMLLNTTGHDNVAVGTDALVHNDTGVQNTATGSFALFSNTGGGNTATGAQALQSNTIGGNNTAIGAGTLFFTTNSNNNTALGANAGDSVTTASNVICIGANGADVSDSCFIGNIRDVTTHINNAIPVLIDAAGQLGTMSSSKRFKKEIKPMDDASEAILALKPVTFHYKSDKTNRPEFGLIAEEVAEVNPYLVVRDKNGEIYTVRYEAVNAMLLNEFLKEHRKVEELTSTVATKLATVAELRSTVAQQQKRMEVLTARLNEQASQIQKVSAQLEASKAAPQVVLNGQ